MLPQHTVDQLRAAVQACDDAREALEDRLQSIDGEASDDQLRSVAETLERWRDAQERFMALVADAPVDDAPTAAMLLKMNHGIDASNARRGIPGVPVEGTDQPFNLEMSGARGMVLTTAATEYVSPSEGS